MKPWAVVALVAVAGDRLAVPDLSTALLDPKAVSRPVKPVATWRPMSRTPSISFATAAPSVVYITSIAVRRNLFNLNVYEIPQGTGSGFIWDKQGRVVTNFHVISDASRLEVTLADQSSWKAVLVGAAPDRDMAVSADQRSRPISCSP
jgi:S1-C subfamily serine protease